MTDPFDDQEARWREDFERLGVNQVRLMLGSGAYPNVMRRVVVSWLTDKDKEREAAEASERVRQADVEKWANKRDSVAAAAAIIAAVASIVGAFISYFAWLHPHAPS